MLHFRCIFHEENKVRILYPDMQSIWSEIALLFSIQRNWGGTPGFPFPRDPVSSTDGKPLLYNAYFQFMS